MVVSSNAGRGQPCSVVNRIKTRGAYVNIYKYRVISSSEYYKATSWEPDRPIKKIV